MSFLKLDATLTRTGSLTRIRGSMLDHENGTLIVLAIQSPSSQNSRASEVCIQRFHAKSHAPTRNTLLGPYPRCVRGASASCHAASVCPVNATPTAPRFVTANPSGDPATRSYSIVSHGSRRLWITDTDSV